MNLVRRNPRLVISTPSEIQRLVADFYGFRGAVAAAEEQVTTGVDIGNSRAAGPRSPRRRGGNRHGHIVAAVVDYLFHYTLDQRADDMHRAAPRPSRRCACASTCTGSTPAEPVHAAVVFASRTLARLDIAEKRRPQDGRVRRRARYPRGRAPASRPVSTGRSARSSSVGPSSTRSPGHGEAWPELGMFDAAARAPRGAVPARARTASCRHGPDRGAARPRRS